VRRIRVALVEDHSVLSEAMRISLADRGFDVAVVPLSGETSGSRASLIDRVLALEPDIVLLDLDLGPAGDGAALLPRLWDAGCRVIVLTATKDFPRWGECLAHGALAVMSKSENLTTVVDAMLAAVKGLPAMPGPERASLIARWRERSARVEQARARLARLTPREMEVLEGLAGGHRVSEIARSSCVSEATVRTQVKSVLSKLQVSSQIAAVALVRDAGMAADSTDDAATLPEAR
jgi:two-component system, NarL family, nitrate/nitrite response regulator NarL